MAEVRRMNGCGRGGWALAALLACGPAAGQERLSERLASPEVPGPVRVVGATLAAALRATPGGALPQAGSTDTVRLVVEAEGRRALVVDAGAVLRAGEAAWALVPNQRFLVEGRATVEVEALPLSPSQAAPVGAPLVAHMAVPPGVLPVLRTFERLEGERVQTLRRYVDDGAKPAVDTLVRNRDVDLARAMTWRRGPEGVAVGRLDRDMLRAALWAVTAELEIQGLADWLRRERGHTLEVAVEAAGALSARTELLLERAGLNHRVFSQRHGDHHFNAGLAAFEAGDPGRAAEAFAQAERLSPGDVEAKYAEGVALFRQGKLEEARGAFLVATGMPGATADAHYNRGVVAWALGDRPGAARAFRGALALQPDHLEATVWLQRADPEGRSAPASDPPRAARPSTRGRR
jgi:hypothetical protein